MVDSLPVVEFQVGKWYYLGGKKNVDNFWSNVLFPIQIHVALTHCYFHL